MSSDISEKLLEGLRATVVEVLGTMAWSEVIFVGVDESRSFTLSNEAVGLIQLYGTHYGMVGITANRSLTAEIVARITGLPADDLTQDDLLDGVAELANMICGGMKTKAQVTTLDLAPPISLVGKDFVGQWKTDHPTKILTFRLEEEVLQVYACI